MEKQTAVEWLVEKMTQRDFIAIPKPEWIEQAKAMENNQRLEDFKEGFQAAFDSLSSANNLVQNKTFKSE